jgi:hypothetical protein
MFYFAPSNLPLNWPADGLIKIRKSTLWKLDGCFRQRGCHHVSHWAERYLPADLQRSGARKSS